MMKIKLGKPSTSDDSYVEGAEFTIGTEYVWIQVGDKEASIKIEEFNKLLRLFS